MKQETDNSEGVVEQIERGMGRLTSKKSFLSDSMGTLIGRSLVPLAGI